MMDGQDDAEPRKNPSGKPRKPRARKGAKPSSPERGPSGVEPGKTDEARGQEQRGPSTPPSPGGSPSISEEEGTSPGTYPPEE